MEADRVSGMETAYKIKLRAVGLRMVYVVGKRDKKEAYRKAKVRTKTVPN